jgi:hypothetical protein
LHLMFYSGPATPQDTISGTILKKKWSISTPTFSV